MPRSPGQFDPEETMPNAPPGPTGLDETVPNIPSPPAQGDETVATPGPADAERTMSTGGPSLDAFQAPKKRRRDVFPKIDGYEIKRLIGRGGMGVVYEAVQQKLGRRVALKLLPAVMTTAQPELVKRFQHEAENSAKLHHKNIIPIYDFGESRDGYYYVMEMLEGQPLNEVVKKFTGMGLTSPPTSIADILGTDEHRVNTSQSMASSDRSRPSYFDQTTGRDRHYYQLTANWIADIADALHYAHQQGMIHRDVKPSNIFICTDGRAVLLDFGLVKVVGDESITMSGAVVGSCRYMSPEQTGMTKRVMDPRTDVYSLGISLYEILTFQPAFNAPDQARLFQDIASRDPTAPSKIIRAIPADLETICLKAMEKAPSARYQTAKQMADDLHLYLRGLPIVARRVGPVGRITRFIRRHPAATLTTMTTVLLLIAISAAIIYQGYARQSRLETLVEKGATEMQLKRWHNAVEPFTAVLKEDPKNFRGLVNLAITKKELYYEDNDADLLDESNALLTRALEVVPDENTIWNMKGIVLRTQGKLDEALEALERACELQDDYYPTWVNLGSVHALNGDLEKSEQCLETGTKLLAEHDPPVVTDSLPWHNLAAVQLELGRPSALDSIQEALAADIRADKKGVASQVLRAKMHLRLSGARDPDLALDYARSAQLNCPEDRHDPQVYRVLAMCLLATEQWSKMRTAAEQALEYGDTPSYPHLMLAIADARAGNNESAHQHLNEALAAYPAALKEQSFRVVVEGGTLWFDSAYELESLRRDAEALLNEAQ